MRQAARTYSPVLQTARAINVPLVWVSVGAGRSPVDTRIGRSSYISLLIAQIPKLTVWARFPSPAPCENAGQVTAAGCPPLSRQLLSVIVPFRRSGGRVPGRIRWPSADQADSPIWGRLPYERRALSQDSQKVGSTTAVRCRQVTHGNLTAARRESPAPAPPGVARRRVPRSRGCQDRPRSSHARRGCGSRRSAAIALPDARRPTRPTGQRLPRR